ncbi:Putative Dimethylglycine oxidase [Brachybacterium nesterenkovii]|uniref:Putative Dimethylglycine oxidase n=2 Tax=Brachybacterium nesterenkovii TaxID=47847 RepID=A0A1X6WW59_9MICO|nr:Putative Dimethylglycine oxidase [Brachybacterium nesterenkovii]
METMMTLATRTTAPAAPAQPLVGPGRRVVVIGAGVVGAALADELVARGVTDVTIVDQGDLWETGGSSSHAPGFVFQTNPSRVMCLLAQRTVAKLAGLQSDGQPVVDAVGGLEIATTEGQLAELRRRLGFARAWGVPAELVDGDRAAELWPGLDSDRILGALHTPTDGVVHSRRAVRAQGERAVAGGATALGATRVVEVCVEDGRVTGVVVENALDGGDRRTIEADAVVACGGIWGPALTRLAGVEAPMQPMEHGFAWTEPLASLAGAEQGPESPTRPIVRHQAAGVYFREFGERIGIGAYEHRPIPVDPENLTDTAHMRATGTHPAKREFTPADFEHGWKAVQEVLPETAGLELGDEFNGVFSFTPDGGPLLGPSRTVGGFWVGQAVWVTQSAGCAQVLAEWMTTGDPGIDPHELDLHRFEPSTLSRGWIRERGCESYDTVYDVSFPRGSTSVQRGRKTSPFYLRHQLAGAVFTEASDWERPQYFEENARILSSAAFRAADTGVPVHVPKHDAWDHAGWSAIAAAEAWSTRTRAGLFDMSALSRFLIEGPGATDFLETVCSAKVGRRVGTVAYAMLLDDKGGIRSDVTVTRLAPERYLMGSNGPLDLDHLLRMRPDPAIHIEDITTSTCCLGLWGPRARDILEPITEGDISHEGLGYFRAAEIMVADVPVLALRVSYVGDLGWELYTDAAYGLHLFDAIRAAGAEHGLVLAGRLAFNSMRLEKGYRSHGTDVTREDTPATSGLGFAVSPRKTEFIGHDALAALPDGGGLTEDAPHLATVGLRMETGVPDAGSPVTDADGQVVGWVTSSDYSYETGQVLAYVRVPRALAEVGTALRVERLGRSLPARVLADPVVDPEGERIRR